MSLGVHIMTAYLEHESGTKSYEIVSVGSESKPYLVITRWGSLHSPGEIQIRQSGSEREARSEMLSIRKAKEKRGYEDKATSEGLHGLRIKEFTVELLKRELIAHYGIKNAKRVFYGLGLDAEEVISHAGATAVDDESDDIVVEEPPTELKRDRKWGSW